MNPAPQNVGFQTGHGNTRHSHAFDRSAFPPSQSTAAERSLLNGTVQRLNEAEFCQFSQKIMTLEVLP
jgi:hypothetical protein